MLGFGSGKFNQATFGKMESTLWDNQDLPDATWGEQDLSDATWGEQDLSDATWSTQTVS